MIEREYQFGGARLIQLFLAHRSIQSIRNRAAFLGVKAKLSRQDKILIRGLSDFLPQKAIAEKFGVDRKTIYNLTKVSA